jgi:hypothetical protein
MLKTEKIRLHINSIKYFLLVFALISTELCAQQKLPSVVISIDVKEATAEEVIEIIRAKAGINFSYNPKKLPTNRVSLDVRDQDLESILGVLSAKFNLDFQSFEGQVIVTARKSRQKENVTISGMVTDLTNGEPLIGATIYLEELKTGTTTNPFGFYSLTLPRSTYTLRCTYLGFAVQTLHVELQNDYQHRFAMEEEAPTLEEIVVTNNSPDVVSLVRTGNTDIRPVSTQERPSFFGEPDVVKSLESLPGIKLHSDGSTFYYVRGGDRDQNMLIVDDAPIYNPSHMLGMFSTVIPDAINDMTLYKGDMPASLGGRLSSVLDIRTKKGNDQHFAAWGDVGLISTKIGVEAPFKKDVSSFLVSTRFSRLKWILRLADRDVSKFNFYDFTGKMNFKLNQANRIFFSFYTGADNYIGANNGLAWSNTAATFRWNHLFSDRLFLNTTVAGSGYHYFLYQDVSTETGWKSNISNFNVKTDFNYYIAPGHELSFGTGLNGYGFNPGNLQTERIVPPRLSLSVRNSMEFVLYGNHEIALTEQLGINYGLRVSSWTNSGEAFEFRFNEFGMPIDTLVFEKGENYKTYRNIEPRFTIAYKLNETSSVKANISKNVQNIHLISNSISPFTSLEVWLPSSINIRPQRAVQTTLGYYKNITSLGMSLTVEAFYKKMANQIDYAAHAETLLNPFIESELRFGDGIAYGIELLGKKDEGKLRGWAGYSYARAKRKIDGVNNGETYNAFFDRPHQINVMASYDLSQRWNVGLNWLFSTGAPFSSPIGFFYYNGEEVPRYGQKNNDRLPDYHRLDLAATVKLNKNSESQFRHSISFSVYNFYARKNALFINYNKVETANEQFRIPSDLADPERVTSQYFLFRFTPSVSYNFKWR